MAAGNYIKIDRKILDWEWYQDINTSRLFIHLLLRANWKDGAFQGIPVPRGSLISSTRKLAEETGLTEREVRTAISHLKTTHEVTSKSHSKFTVFTIKNYDTYQTNDTQERKQATKKRQANDKQTTTIEEGKKENREEGKHNNTSCPEPEKSASGSEPVAGAFLLNDGTLYNVTENDVVMYQQLYPGIDCRAELRKITGWCEANYKNRKTRTGAKRFLNNWLSRAQDRAPVRQQKGADTYAGGGSTEDFYRRYMDGCSS